MAQHDGVIDNGTGSAVRTDINNALAAINSNNSGASDPSTTYAYQFYADEGDNTFKIRNASNNGYINISIVGGLGTENFGLAPLSGATFTGTVKLNDNVKAVFGTSDDLEIFHDGTHSRIKDVGTGNLFISGTNTQLINAAGSETIAKFTEDGPVELYHNGTKTFETTASGFSAIGGTFTGDVILDNQSDLRFEEATANGSNFIALQAPAAITSDVTLTLPAVAPTAGQVLQADSSTPTTLTWGSASGVGGGTGIDFNDSVKVRFGTDNDAEIYHNGNSLYIDNNTNHIYIRSNVDGDDGGNIYLQAKSGENGIIVQDDGPVNLYYNNSVRLSTSLDGCTISGALAGVGVGTAVAILREKQAHAVDAGTFTNGADRVRVLNTEEHDGESFCTLDTSTGEFTLPAGTYLMFFQAGGFDIGANRTKIVTDGGTDKLFGNNVFSSTSYPNVMMSFGFGVVTNASSEGYFLKHRCATTKASTGLGRDCNFASEEEFYAQVVIWRMDT
tara:strand:+ start:738 stop:2246 length:1509 start_codon:yes stop_codon:yes gene_type:complete